MADQPFTVEIRDRDSDPIIIHAGMTLMPERWSDMDIGGPDAAIITATGPAMALRESLRWLRYEVRIANQFGSTVWWGYINEIDLLARERATIRCLGWWHLLDWRYYANSDGREEHDTTTSAEQALGLGFTSDDFGVASDVLDLYEHDCKFAGFDAGSKFVVSGSDNDGTYTVKNTSEEEQTTYTNTSISFEPADDIRDTANKGLAIFANEYLEVSGSTSNDGFHLITSTADTAITTREGVTGNIVTEAAGATVTITQGSSVQVKESVTDYEIPGTNTGVTVTAYGEKIAHQFENNSGSNFTVARIGIKIRKVGSPTDAVTVALYSDSSDSVSTLLDSGTIAAADIGATLTWEWADLANTQTITTSAKYWIVLSRGGANDAENYYRVAIDENLGYESGLDNGMKVYDGSAWYNRPTTTADLLFRVWGAIETTTQIDTIATNNGQVFTDVAIRDESGIDTNQYRDGSNTARVEVEDLIELGTSAGNALKARVNRERAIIIEAAPSAIVPKFAIQDGDAVGYRIGLESMSNRIQVLYSYVDVDGETQNGTTAWSANDASVDRYGYKELRHSADGYEADQADDLLALLVSDLALPTAAIDLGDEALTMRQGGVVEPGRLVSGEWVSISGAPSARDSLMVTSKIYIASSEYDAQQRRLTVRPKAAADPWDIGAILQG